jgi:glycosyltransferase involved in cell wall biosynthesis
MDARMVKDKPHGIARYVLDLLGEFSKQDIDISLLVSEKTPRERFKDFKIQNLTPCKVDFANPLELPELTKAVKLSKFDVVHFPSFSVPLLMPANSVVTIHDLIHLKGEPGLAHKIYYSTVVKRSLKKCARVIAVSDWTKKDLIDQLGIPSDKITVVRNGVNPFWFKQTWVGPQERKPEKSAEKTEEKAAHFVCLANPKPHKNVQTLIQACRELWQDGKTFKLFLSLGGHDLSPEWPISSGERAKIHILKNAPNEEISELIRTSVALVSPSLWEGFNYPAAEALAMGAPVIVSRGSAHDELEGDRLTIYGEPTDQKALARAMSEALQNAPSLKKTHSVHSLSEMASETLKIYRDILDLKPMY